MKRHGLFDALIPMPGGKRLLVGWILSAILAFSQKPLRVADPFLGGGAVSLALKARGYQVLASDIAERSCLAGRALVENGHLQITDTDRARLEVRQLSLPNRRSGAGNPRRSARRWPG